MAIIRKAATALRQPDTWIYILFVAVMVGLSTGVLAHSGDVSGDHGSQTSSPVSLAVVLQAREVNVGPENGTRYSGTAFGAALGGGIDAVLGRVLV